MADVEVSQTGGRVDLELNRPEVLNAMSWDVFDGLSAAADEIAALDDVRVVVISGRGRSFSSGIDTSSFGGLSGEPAANIARAQAGFRKVAALPVPTMAAVRGHALGAGLQLALACDLRVVTADAELGLLEARYGIIPDLGGTQRLPALVGPARAKKMIWLAERISGTDAGRIGLAEEVADPEAFEARVDEIAQALENAPPLVAAAVKRLVDGAPRRDVAAAMDAEAAAQLGPLASHDFGEAIAAWIERRPPRFTGR